MPDPVTAQLAAAAADAPDLEGVARWLADLIDALGAVGVGAVVLVEVVFPPIPSELVLPLAGFRAATGPMPLVGVIGWATAGSVLGAWVFYAASALVGEARMRGWIARMPLVDPAGLDRASAWFRDHGERAVLIGRCVPLVRSLVSIPAGAQRMPLARFTVYTAAGSAVWNAALVLGGFALGERWHVVGDYVEVLEYLVVAAVVAFVARLAWSRWRARRSAGRDAAERSAEDPARR